MEKDKGSVAGRDRERGVKRGAELLCKREGHDEEKYR